MSKYYSNGLMMHGLTSRKGTKMVLFEDGDLKHYSYLKEIVGNFTGFASEMSESGIIAVGERASYIKAHLPELFEWPEHNVYDVAGWNGPDFVLSNGRTFSPEGHPVGTAVFKPCSDRFGARGSLAGWLEEVAEPFAGNPIPEFFLGLMFVGPLVSLSGLLMNPGYGLVGPKETGKTHLFGVMASVCGDPAPSADGDEYALSFSGTGNGIEAEMANYADLTMLLDEAALFGYGQSAVARGRAVIEVSMRLAEGREKRRYQSLSRRFRFAYVSSANDEFTASLQGAGSEELIDAIISRIPSISLAGRELGILDKIPEPYADLGDFVAAINEACSRHHGQALPVFIAGVVRMRHSDEERLKGKIRKHMADFRNAASNRNARKASRRVVDSFALGYAACSLARYLGVLPASYDSLESTLSCYDLHVRATASPPRPIDILTSMLHDPEVIELSGSRLPKMTDADIAQAAGFKRLLIDGTTELVVSKSAVCRREPSLYAACRNRGPVRDHLVREGKHLTTYRKVRLKKRDRMLVFRFEADSPYLN